MLLACNRSTGINIGFPDICLTPAAPAPIPIPYPNLGMTSMAFPFSFFVKFMFIPAMNLMSKILMTTGDEGGVAHATFKGSGSYTLGNPLVFVDYAPATHLCCLTTGNNFNNFLGALLVPCITNVFITCALPPALTASAAGDTAEGEPPAAGDMDVETMRRLAEVTRGDGEVVTARQTDSGVVVLGIGTMPSNVTTLVYRALAGFDGVTGVVIDLRGNPGGDGRAALELANEFLPRGTVMLQLRHADGDVEPVRARRSPTYEQPLAVVIGAATASAAELFTAALQFHGRAQVVGARSYGKAEAQELVRGEQGSRYMTVATYELPDGSPLHEHGVVPDVHSETPIEDALRQLLA